MNDGYRFSLILAGFILGIGYGGCIPVDPVPNINDNAGNNSNNDNGAADMIVPSVTLTVNNPSPQVLEPVVLTCRTTNTPGGSVTYSFSPDNRLVVDSLTGQATFIVNEADVNASLTFTCSASNEAGASAPSTPAIVIPRDVDDPLDPNNGEPDAPSNPGQVEDPLDPDDPNNPIDPVNSIDPIILPAISTI